MAPTSGPSPSPDAGTQRDRRRRRLRAALAALFIAALAALAAGLVLLLPGMVRERVIAEARARGVTLDPGAIDLAVGEIRLRGARFSLLGVRGLSGTISRATIELRGLEPRWIAAEGVDVSVVGLDALEGLPAWAARHGDRAAALPLSASPIRIGLRDREDAAEALALADTSLQMPALSALAAATAPPAVASRVVVAPASTLPAAAPSAVTSSAAVPSAMTPSAAATPVDAARHGASLPQRGVLRNARVLIASKEITRTDVAWAIGETTLTVGLGGHDVAAAPLRAELRARPAPAASIEIAPTPLAAAAALLGLDVGASTITVAGTIELRLPAGAAPTTLSDAPLEGSLALTAKGLVLPHPRELDGLLFGDTTTIKADARFAPDRQHVSLSRVEVAAGALKLGGTGAIQRDGADASITMDLSGSVPCSLMAGSAAMAHLTGPVGLLARDLARRTLAGTVAVQVHIDARASRLQAARVTPSAVLRCKIRL